MENMEKYNYYKGKTDYHMGMLNKYKGSSKSKYAIHYRYYHYYHAKMIFYGNKCGSVHEYHHPVNVCETHTYYKHIYHHEHIDVHHQSCKQRNCCGRGRRK